VDSENGIAGRDVPPCQLLGFDPSSPFSYYRHDHQYHRFQLITITIIMISIIILVVYSETAMTLKSETAMTLKGKKGDGGTLKMPLQGIAAFPSITLYHAHALHEVSMPR